MIVIMIITLIHFFIVNVPEQVRNDLVEFCKVRETLVGDKDPDYNKTFVAGIREVLPDASIFLPGE